MAGLGAAGTGGGGGAGGGEYSGGEVGGRFGSVEELHCYLPVDKVAGRCLFRKIKKT